MNTSWKEGTKACFSRKLALEHAGVVVYKFFLGSSMGETKAHGLKRPQIKGFKGRSGGWGVLQA